MEFALQKTLSAAEVKIIRKKMGMKQKEFAQLLNVSVKTVEHWESNGSIVKGASAAFLCVLRERTWLKDELEIPEKRYPLRLRYMYRQRLCTLIDVDDKAQRVEIKNYVTDPVYRAFGRNEHPKYSDYLGFLESRCFPPARDKMKIMLNALNLPFYDPFMIIEKTKGRMADDEFQIEIER